LARELADWIQKQAQQHYIADGPIDHWATLEETFRTNGDDCDGLELLVYNLLRDLGFGDEEVFRAIVYRRSDKQHHMVTFWFEDPNDPWVIDPTGAMTTGMPRMSEMPGWAPLKVFSEDSNYNVDQQRVAQQEPPIRATSP
jgi:predicted transglutaminase-like cysteine proteinase